MYGQGIPVLFPLGLISLIVAYIVERISLARVYRRPPRYSKELADSNAKDLVWVPILYSMGGFWMFSNR